MLIMRQQWQYDMKNASSHKRNGCFLRPITCRSASCSRRAISVAASSESKAVSLPYQTKPGAEASLSDCIYSSVEADNGAHPKYTVLRVECPDTPGLLRVLSWVLNGMSVRVQHATLETTPEGAARDKLWVTDFRGRKLTDSSAESLRSRLEDFLVVCAAQGTGTDNEWRCGNIRVSNTVDPDLTEVLVFGEPSAHRPGFLLELTTALTAVGASIAEGAIQGDEQPPEPGCDVAEPGHDFRGGRLFKFMLRGPRGGQMDADQVASLIFTLRLLQGKGSMPTVAPNMDALLR